MRISFPWNHLRFIFFIGLLFLSRNLLAQAENEIQVYASPTIEPGVSLFELHTNYTFEGVRVGPLEPSYEKYLNLSLEFTHGISQNFELGFYVFTTLKP